MEGKLSSCSPVVPAESVRGWLSPQLHRQLTRAKAWHSFVDGVNMVANGIRAAFMLDYTAPKVEELRQFLSAAWAGSAQMREVGALRLDHMVLFVNLRLMRKRLSAEELQQPPVVWVNVHRTLDAPRVCSAEEEQVTLNGLTLVASQLGAALEETIDDQPYVAVFDRRMWEHVFGSALLGYLLEYPVIYTSCPSASNTESNCLDFESLQVHTFETTIPTSPRRLQVQRFSVPENLLGAESEYANSIAAALSRHEKELARRAQEAGVTLHHTTERVLLPRVIL